MLYVYSVSLRLGLPHNLIHLIMLSVSSVSYSYLFNGFQFGRLVPERGLRQGDPLSPYLFICVVEAFIALIARAEELGQIHGVRIAPSAPSISTLCFADDTMLFCRANEEEAGTLKRLLDLYAAASGQVINFEKSAITFSPRGESGCARSYCKFAWSRWSRYCKQT